MNALPGETVGTGLDSLGDTAVISELADSVLGAALMRAQGRAAWMRFNAALAEGRAPGREVMDDVLVI